MYPAKKVSIIIPCYNDADNLQGLLENLAFLDLQEIEVIIIDGASDDYTKEVVKKYNHIVSCFVSEPDKGIYDAMNKGIARAKGDYLFFLGADDRLFRTFNEAIHFLVNQQTIYYGKVYNQTGAFWYQGIFNKVRLLKENLAHQSIFYPRGVFIKYSYDIRYRLMADYKLNIQLFGDITFKKSYLDIQLATYSGDGISARVREKKFAFLSYFLILKCFGIKYVFLKLYFKLQSII